MSLIEPDPAAAAGERLAVDLHYQNRSFISLVKWTATEFDFYLENWPTIKNLTERFAAHG